MDIGNGVIDTLSYGGAAPAPNVQNTTVTSLDAGKLLGVSEIGGCALTEVAESSSTLEPYYPLPPASGQRTSLALAVGASSMAVAMELAELSMLPRLNQAIYPTVLYCEPQLTSTSSEKHSLPCIPTVQLSWCR